MKRIILFAALLWHTTVAAQQLVPGTTSAEMPAAVPPYAYCEIIGNHLPSYNGEGVLFDFGQQTATWAYNWLQNSEGQKIIFNSNIEALNYMICQGWNFVQAFTSGEKNQNIHYLLRIQTSRLTESQLQQLLTKPRTKSDKKK